MKKAPLILTTSVGNIEPVHSLSFCGIKNPDHVFGMDSTNSQIFDTLVEPIIQSVMEGFNGEYW